MKKPDGPIWDTWKTNDNFTTLSADFLTASCAWYFVKTVYKSATTHSPIVCMDFPVLRYSAVVSFEHGLH
jgi:hypothetical protein